MRNLLLVTIALMSAPCVSLAEVYKDFKPFMTLHNIKNNYPNGRFEEVKAAWVTSDMGFYLLTGSGISGKIYLAFDSTDSFWKSAIEEKQNEIAKLEPEADAQKIREFNINISNYQRFIDQPIEKRLTLSWVRWVPNEEIPLERLQSKYGKVESCGYNDENFRPFCEWTSRGLLVDLSDDKKNVFTIQYSFTQDDYNRAMGAIIPEKKESTIQPKLNNESKKRKKL